MEYSVRTCAKGKLTEFPCQIDSAECLGFSGGEGSNKTFLCHGVSVLLTCIGMGGGRCFKMPILIGQAYLGWSWESDF